MSRHYDQLVLDAKSAADSTGIGYFTGVPGTTNANDCISASAQVTEYGIYVEFSAGSGAGTVLIETASDPSYSGTWAVLATVNWAAASKSHYTALTNSVRVLRARISSAVTSGTVSVRIIANAIG